MPPSADKVLNMKEPMTPPPQQQPPPPLNFSVAPSTQENWNQIPSAPMVAPSPVPPPEKLQTASPPPAQLQLAPTDLSVSSPTVPAPIIAMPAVLRSSHMTPMQ